MAGNPLNNVGDVPQLSEARLWKTLDNISDRLGGIESRLSELVRLEERVNNHDQSLSRYARRLDDHDTRLRESELWQANYGDRSSVERLITHVQEDVNSIKKKVDDLESNKDVTKGSKDISKEIFKWIAGVLAAILIYKLTKG